LDFFNTPRRVSTAGRLVGEPPALPSRNTNKGRELKAAAEKWQAESQNRERWKEIEESLKKAGEELEKAFAAAFRKKNSSN